MYLSIPHLFYMKKTLKKRSDLHLARKFWHMIPGLIISLIIFFEPINLFLFTLILGVSGLMVGFFEILRLRNDQVNLLAIKTAKIVMRKEELREISGTPYYLLSSFIVLLFFPKEIAILSILYLAIGDPIASIFGIKFGKDSYRFKNGKSVVGTIASVSFCMVITLFLGLFFNWNTSQLYTISLFGGLAGGLSETFNIEDINDNFTIPLISAIVLQGIYLQLGLI